MVGKPSDPAFLCGTYGVTNRDGLPCQGTVIAGTQRCRVHCGKKTAKAKAEGAVALELLQWGLTGHKTMADAGETLLRLVTQSAARVEFYARLLGTAVEEHEGDPTRMDTVMRQSGVAALIGYKYGVDREGNRFP